MVFVRRVCGLVGAFLSLNLAAITQSCAPFEPLQMDQNMLASQTPGGSNVALPSSEEAFAKALHPLLRQKCAECHGVAQRPLFAVLDPVKAHTALTEHQMVNLNDVSNSAIVQKVRIGHNGLDPGLGYLIEDGILLWAGQLNPGRDVTRPTTFIMEPKANAVIKGTVLIQAVASDNVGVTGVQLILDGTALEKIEAKTPPFAWPWDTTKATPGIHTLATRARDAAGNWGFSPVVTVTIEAQAAGPDTIAPSVSVTSPQVNAVLTGVTNLVASASDNVGVVGVQFILDGVNFGAEDTTAPFSVSLDTKTLTNGNHTVSAKARDAAGNSTTSVVVNFSVNNPVPAATFAWISQNIFGPKCVSCHNATTHYNDVDLSTYSKVMSTGSVVAGSPSTSKMVIQVNSGAMPKIGTQLTPAEAGAVSTWIQNGAPN